MDEIIHSDGCVLIAALATWYDTHTHVHLYTDWLNKQASWHLIHPVDDAYCPMFFTHTQTYIYIYYMYIV